MADFSDSELESDVSALDELFNAAAQHVQRTHAQYSQQDLLEIYGLYKQATAGKCNVTKPNIFNMQARQKWSAWYDLGEMAEEKAKELYIDKVKKLDPKWHQTVDEDGPTKFNSGWVVHSIELPPQDERAEHEKTIFDHVKEKNLSKLKQELKSHHLFELDEHEMGLIHWATDRNALDILEFLLQSGVDVNMRDGDEQTALHYAVSCEYSECIELLLKFNANPNAQDKEGQACMESNCAES